MRKVVAAAGLASPRFRLCVDPNDADSFYREVGFPVVLKTPQGAGTNLVRKCLTPAEVNWAFNEIRTTRDLFGQTADSVVAEEFIEGDEYAVNLFHDGERIHVVDAWKYDKFDTAWANNLYRSVILCDFETDEMAAIREYARQVAHAVGLRVGYAHCEVKILSQAKTTDPDRDWPATAGRRPHRALPGEHSFRSLSTHASRIPE
jgi:biotin carboxylase